MSMTEVRKEKKGMKRIVGDHEVIFAGPDEVIEFRHTAYSKTVFAKGAVEAAKFLSGKPAGLYNMSHVINK